MIGRPPERRQFYFVVDHSSVDVADQTTLVVLFIFQLSSACGINPCVIASKIHDCIILFIGLSQ